MNYFGSLVNLALVTGVVALAILGWPAGGGYPCLDRDGMPAAKEIFEGVLYGCERLGPGREGDGFLYWMRIDLAAPGIEIYVTPKDPTATNLGWQYRLRRIGNVVDRENLAVAINGTLFTSDASWSILPGGLANGAYTVVSDHAVNSLFDTYTYLLWFDDQLTPHLLRERRPPTVAELAMAKWGISAPGIPLLSEGEVSLNGNVNPDSRTAIAIDGPRKLLFLAVGDNISPRSILEKLADLGAKDGFLLDGGQSSSMAIGKDANGVSAGIVTGGWQPVATFFGIRAKRISN